LQCSEQLKYTTAKPDFTTRQVATTATFRGLKNSSNKHTMSSL